jgi:hypothetical protein
MHPLPPGATNPGGKSALIPIGEPILQMLNRVICCKLVCLAGSPSNPLSFVPTGAVSWCTYSDRTTHAAKSDGGEATDKEDLLQPILNRGAKCACSPAGRPY